jgi:hypothetical protein
LFTLYPIHKLIREQNGNGKGVFGSQATKMLGGQPCRNVSPCS